MKNIHILPTDKPSRLVIDTIENKLYYQSILHNKTVNVLTHNIYITSDEEIKKGDWCLDLRDNSTFKIKLSIDGVGLILKIILTTDQDLIKDGVQAIPDEFLEWFVKNPSCEEVEVKQSIYPINTHKFGQTKYKIIIPKEEPKQETLEEAILRIKSENEHYIDEEAFELGAKWQSKRMYSEEEVLKAQQAILGNLKDALQDENYIIEFLEKFKNK
jgi:hypothetical protein